jgi:hypothetical protein
LATQHTPTPTRGGTTFRPRSGPTVLTGDPALLRDHVPVTSEPPSRQPITTGVADAGVDAQVVAALRLAEEFGGARLLVSDLRVAFLLINHARQRTIARLFGVPRDRANLVTLVAVMVLADTVHDKIKTVLSGPPVPSLGDGLFASASLRNCCGALPDHPLAIRRSRPRF